METKVLLRLIKDDIKILENINDSFISQANPTCEEAEVALARAKALVMEFEMLSKNLSKEEQPQLFDEIKINAAEEEKSEKKIRSLRNFLPFIKSGEEKSVSPDTDHLQDKKEESQALKTDNFSPSGKSVNGMEDSSSVIESTNHIDAIPRIVPEENVTPSLIPESESDEEGNQMGNQPFSFLPESTGKEIDAEHLTDPEEIAIEADATSEEQTEMELLAENEGEGKKTLGETLGEKHQLVNDLLSQERSDAKFETKPLKSIREGIGINDRFLFIKELFRNNSEEYELAIKTLDELPGIEDAVKFLKQNFKWNKSEAGEKFLLLIKRRFAK